MVLTLGCFMAYRGELIECALCWIGLRIWAHSCHSSLSFSASAHLSGVGDGATTVHLVSGVLRRSLLSS
jgi:hypothetical protein